MYRLLLLLAPVVAHAETTPDPDAWYPRLTAGAGIGYRAGELAVLHPNGASATANVEVKLRPALFVGATFEHAPNTAHDDLLDRDYAITTRAAGVHVRNILLGFGDKPKGFGGDWFVTGGLAREWIAWDGGGMQRTALALGAGTTVLLPRSGDVHRQLRFGLRILFARAPEPAKRPEGCDGPCDTATATEPYDTAFVMEVSCHLGR